MAIVGDNVAEPAPHAQSQLILGLSFTLLIPKYSRETHMSNYYQHIPIVGARSIRVLELQPANDLIAPIHCKLKTVSLNDFPQWHANYTALSYTWDGQNPSRQVNCDGGSLLITPNCEEAIRQLRSAKETQVLWIDSICIDQTPEAVKERNIQVALMGEIYKSAARVVVWLGSGNERVERALQQIMNIAMITRSAPRDLANRKMIQEKLRTYTRNLSDSECSESAISLQTHNFQALTRLRPIR